MKTMLPKLVVGILIVPFTWFIVSATLSIANILTASVIQLPVDMITKTPQGKNVLNDPIIPTDIIYNKDVDYGTGKSAGEGDGGTTDNYFKDNGHFSATDCSAGGAGKAAGGCISIADVLTNGK